MNKKFIKKNLFMIIFMAMAVVVVAVLLIMVSMEHKSMQEYDTKKKALLKKIQQLFNQRYNPVKINVERIKRDVKGYEEESDKIEYKFGKPYEVALQQFAETLGIPLDELKRKFSEFWDSQQGGSTRDLIYRRYKVLQFGKDFPKHKSNWSEAITAFMHEAQKVTLEEIDLSNVDDIFLSAMGKGRKFSDSPARCQAFMKRMRIKMLEYFNSKKVGCEDASNFSFNHDRLPPGQEIEHIARSWEIVSDLTKRIADAKTDPKMDSLDLIEFSKRDLYGAKDGQYTSYRFTFTVKADIDSLRRLVKNLYDAYEVNRIYAVRNLTLNRVIDQVDTIITESERVQDDTEFDTGKTDKSKEAFPDLLPESPVKPKPVVVPKKVVEIKKKVLGPKDPGYARIIVGNINTIRAEFEIDYIVFEN